jgi:hypothetical protein
VRGSVSAGAAKCSRTIFGSLGGAGAVWPVMCARPAPPPLRTPCDHRLAVWGAYHRLNHSCNTDCLLTFIIHCALMESVLTQGVSTWIR